MKKLFLLLLFFGTITYSHAGDSSNVHKSVAEVKDAVVSALDIPDSASLSFSKVYSDVKVGISALASSLKVGAEHVYYILVKQQVVKSVIWLIVFIISIVCLIASIKIYLREDLEWRDPNILNLTCVLLFIIFIVTFIISLCHIDTIVTGFVNPEYGAIKDIISIVNPPAKQYGRRNKYLLGIFHLGMENEK